MLPSAPLSPVLATTTTPAATAAWSASATGSSWVFGTGFPPKGSLSTLTWSTMTAHWTAWRIVELKTAEPLPKASIIATSAPGAMPSILMLQPGGSGCAGLTNCDRS